MTTRVVITGTGVPNVSPGRAGPGVAYRVETAERAVVISGDTRVCEEIATFAADADHHADEIRSAGYQGTIIVARDLTEARL